MVRALYQRQCSWTAYLAKHLGRVAILHARTQPSVMDISSCVCSGARERISCLSRSRKFDALKQDAAGSLEVAIRLRLLSAYANVLRSSPCRGGFPDGRNRCIFFIAT